MELIFPPLALHLFLIVSGSEKCLQDHQANNDLLAGGDHKVRPLLESGQPTMTSEFCHLEHISKDRERGKGCEWSTVLFNVPSDTGGAPSFEFSS